jgi:hypothetical protein
MPVSPPRQTLSWRQPVKVYRLAEDQIIKMLFESIEFYQKYNLIYGDEKSAKYAAACRTLANMKERKIKRKPAQRSKVIAG